MEKHQYKKCSFFGSTSINWVIGDQLSLSNNKLSQGLLDMQVNVQLDHIVTRTEPYKPKATLWHKGSGSEKDIIR